VKRASSVDYCHSPTTNLACASLRRVKPQCIMLSVIPNLPMASRGCCVRVVDAGIHCRLDLLRMQGNHSQARPRGSCASECVQAGSVFIRSCRSAHAQAKLQGSQFGDDVCIQGILAEFERKTKRKFDGTQVSSIIKFGMVS